jgi:O-antigen/teichoic acid export membrane protein
VFFPVFFGMLAISEEIVIVVLSEKWLPSLFAFRVFTVLGLLLSYSGIFVVILKSRASTRALFNYSLLSAILFPVGFYFSSHFGLTGVVLSWLVIYPIIFSYLFNAVAKEIEVGVVESLSRVSNAFIGSLAMVAVIFVARYLVFGNEVSMASMLFGIVVGGAAYFAYFWIFSRNTFQDAKNIWKTLRA